MEHKTSKAQRIAAIVGIVVIIALYLVALICAFIDHPMATSVLWSAIFCTFCIPVLIYAFQLFTRIFSSKKDHDTQQNF